ncbi:MAG: peptide-methionine (S)-S-oxide reductase MsrA [Rhodospirillaceae bacterium]|nr:peptide-methionine (S)-S-oxide reductase MsrA [Rhodospirillaceae bacterium]
MMKLRTLLPAMAVAMCLSSPGFAQEFTRIPEMAGAAASSSSATETIVLAGGCFWGVQGVFQHTKGVLSAVSGYAGGESQTAQYETVTSGTTGHAESVKVIYDPKQISLARVLQIYFSVVHDPTQVNRQGPDSGTQYRSVIFPGNDGQAAAAKAYIEQLNQARVYRAAIATKIERGKPFYPAEPYHQDYMTRHPTQPYIAYNDIPKVQALQKMFPDLYRAQPVLVSGKAAGDKN